MKKISTIGADDMFINRLAISEKSTSVLELSTTLSTRVNVFLDPCVPLWRN